MHIDHHRLVRCHPRLSSCMLDSEAIASAVNANLEGWQHLVEGQTEVAIEDFTRAIALGQDLPVAYNNRGIAHEVLGQMVEADSDYSEADRLEKDPATSPRVAKAETHQLERRQRAGRNDRSRRDQLSDFLVRFRSQRKQSSPETAGRRSLLSRTVALLD